MNSSKCVVSYCLSWLQLCCSRIRKTNSHQRASRGIAWERAAAAKETRRTLSKFRCCFCSPRIQKEPLSDALRMFGTTLWKYYESKMRTCQAVLALGGWSSSCCQSVDFFFVPFLFIFSLWTFGWEIGLRNVRVRSGEHKTTDNLWTSLCLFASVKKITKKEVPV